MGQKVVRVMVQVLVLEATLRLVLILVFHWKMSLFMVRAQLNVAKDARNKRVSLCSNEILHFTKLYIEYFWCVIPTSP